MKYHPVLRQLTVFLRLVRSHPFMAAFVLFVGALAATFVFVVWIIFSILSMSNVEIVRQAGIQWNGQAYWNYTCKRYQLLSPGFEDWGINQELDLARTAIKKCPAHNGKKYVKKALWDSRYEVRHRGYKLWARGVLNDPDVNQYVLNKLIEEGPTYFDEEASPSTTLGIVKYVFGGDCRPQLKEFLEKYGSIVEVDPRNPHKIFRTSGSIEYNMIETTCPYSQQRIDDQHLTLRK